jgi:probable addiction module antidote protein
MANEAKLMNASVPYHDLLIEKLKDPEEARVYLEVAIEAFEADGDKEHFLVALRNVTEAQGGIGALARRTEMNREHLYRVLSKKGNPRLDKIGAILHGLGFRLAIEPLQPGV